MRYKKVTLKRGNTVIAEAELTFVEKAIFEVTDKTCVEIRNESGGRIIGTIFPGERFIISKEDFKYDRNPSKS